MALLSQEDEITKAYSQTRAGNRARQDQAKRQAELIQKRQMAASGGNFGGAGLKLAQKTNQQLEETFGAQEADIGAQEATAKAGVAAQREGQEFAAKEAEKGRVFTGEQAALERAQQESQFGRQLKFAADSWLSEFQENQKTNFVNASIALKKGGLSKNTDWVNIIETLKGTGYGGNISAGFEEGVIRDTQNRKAEERAAAEQRIRQRQRMGIIV